jgi:hypothetical protein
MGAKHAPASKRFERYYIPEPNSGCWLWTGALDAGGYGLFRDLSLSRAPRFSYELHCETIPPGLQIDHKCRIRCCVNPDHLEIVTPLENYRRDAGYGGRLYKPRTHCKHGHALTGYNVITRPSVPNQRDCQTCRNEQQRARRKLQCHRKT